MDGEQPLVSVIVPVWNGAECIAECLQSLEAQTYPRRKFEIIVVDNGSTDATAEIVSGFKSVILLHEVRPGSYAARNLGLKSARGSLVALTDADCRAHPDWLRSVTEVARHEPDVGIFAGEVRLEMDSNEGSMVCTAFEGLFSFNQARNIKNGGSVTANWISPAALLRAFGGFRADLKSGGDFELARRMSAAGHPVRYVPQAIVYHPARATFGQLAAKARRVVGGQMARGDRGRGLGWLWRATRTYGSRLRTVWRSPDHGHSMKLRLSLLIVRLHLATCLEVLRIAIGAEPRRA
ncbi:MAG TPA: glycosyltransferase [Allosphingosinicella sp.]|nr:glycosyltransferase [Allosphingosinicella sp.]